MFVNVLHSYPFTCHFNNPEEMKIANDSVKPGDIIFTRLTKSEVKKRPVWQMVAKLQAAFNTITGAKVSSEAEKTVHVGIVVERKDDQLLVADAIPNTGYNLRTVNLWDHSHVALTEGDVCEYDVYRLPEGQEELAQKAAAIAERLTLTSTPVKTKAIEKEYRKDSPEFKAAQGKIREEKTSRLKHKFKSEYSYLEGGKSILFGRTRQGMKSSGARKRFYQALFDEALEAKQTTSDKVTGNEFYCSYFVAHIYQQAESGQLWDGREVVEGEQAYNIKQDLGDLRKKFQENEERIQELKKDPKSLKADPGKRQELKKLNKEQKKIRQTGAQWAKDMAKKDELKLAEKTDSLFLLNSKFLSPQDFRMHVEDKGFTQVGNIKPPKAKSKS